MQPEEAPIVVGYTQEFEDRLRDLARKFRRINEDLAPLVKQLERGELPGDRIPGYTRETYKVRLPNSTANRGKSGGFRVLYYVRSALEVVLLTVYSKTEQDDVRNEAVQSIVLRHEAMKVIQALEEEAALRDRSERSEADPGNESVAE